MPVTEYQQGSQFPGKIGRTVEESEPAWPAPGRAKDGAPNVLFFVLDDVGYGQLSCFGGLVETPNIDRVAASGLRYANMHTTALCSPDPVVHPDRAQPPLQRRRLHHGAGHGYPGYDGRMPFENGMLSEMLLENGYNTFCLGKWHLSPSEDNTPAGPFHRWPLGRGFERFYGFLGGETNQWYPDLTQDNGSVRQPSLPEDGYHLSEDLADQAIQFILDAHVNAPEKPFFMYYATGAAHAPHHVPKEWADRYAGKFDMGWDAYRETVFARQKEIGLLAADAELSRHDPDVPEWDSLNADERRLYARMMEVFAGFLSHADHHFGRILDTLEQIGELDNTLIMVISDNGASAEGGVTGSFNEMLFFNMVPESFEDNLAKIDELGGTKAYNHYPWGWTWAGNTPFRRWKRETYRGGATDPFVVAWPAGIAARGEVRTQYAHADRHGPDRARRDRHRAAGGDPRRGAVAARGGELRAHLRRPGRADARTSPSTSRCSATARSTTTAGGRCVRGRVRATPRRRELGRKFGDTITPEVLDELDREGWELYHIAEDPAESHNVAAEHPDRLRELIALWWSEAGKYKVLPLDGRCSRGSPRSGRRPPSRAAATSTTRTRRWCRRSRHRRSSTARTPSRPTSRSQPAARRASWWRRAATPAGSACTWTTAAAVRLQLRRPRRVRGGVPRRRFPRGGTRSATSSSPPARRTSRSARACRAAGSSTSTARSSATPSSRTPPRCSSSSRGSAAATTSAPRPPTATSRRSRSPARSTRSPSTSPES